MALKEVEIGELREIDAKDIRYRFHKAGNPLKEALMLQDLLEKFGNQQAVASLVEISQGQISKRLRLLGLVEPLQKRLLNGELRASTAYALSKLPDHIQKEFINRDKVFLKDVEEKLRKLAITEELEDLLETPIEIDNDGEIETGSGQVILKVICQKCGVTGVVNTAKPEGSQTWHWTTACDLIPDLDEHSDWDIWFCNSCWREIEELHDDDNRFDTLRSLLQPAKGEVEN